MVRREFIKESTLAIAGLTAGAAPKHQPVKGEPASVLRIGVIGCGVRGSYLIKILQNKIKNISVGALCDIRKSNLEKSVSILPGRPTTYKDYRSLLDDPEVDAVIIATPLHLHFNMATDAVKAGKHVYCEKTLCYDIEQSMKLLRIANSSKTTFQVGYQQRSNPLFQKIGELIQSGSCGTITHIDCAWNRNGDWRRPVDDPVDERLVNWRMYREYSGGLVAELCSHQIDITNHLLGSNPMKVAGFGGIDYWKDGRETFDNVNLVFEYPGGIKARFSALTTNAHEGFYIKIYGTKATIEVNRRNGQSGFIYPERPPENLLNFQVDGVTGATQEAWDRTEGIPIKTDGPTDDEGSTNNALMDFVKCIRTGEMPHANIFSGYLSSVSVHMANSAMYDETHKAWKDEYSIKTALEKS